MNIWQYLDNRNKRKHLKIMIDDVHKKLKENRSLATYIHNNDTAQVKFWYNTGETLRQEYEGLKSRLKNLCG